MDWEQFKVVRFNVSELVAITTDEEYSYARAQRFMLDHEMFTVQAVVLYLMAIVVLKQFMRSRPPFALEAPIKAWNITIAALSGACAVGMSAEFFATLFGKGVNASVCSSSDTFFYGSNGFWLWCYHIIRLFEFTDTLFIILRKQPLLFIHWFHHALTLYVSWVSFAHPSPYSRYGIYANALIHTVMYTYYFLRASKVRVPLAVAKAITTAQIVQFIVASWSIVHPIVLKFVLGMPCELETRTLKCSGLMTAAYLYLFIDFYRGKYNKKGSKISEKAKKCE